LGRKQKYLDEKKEEQVSKLKNKLNDQKQEILRLNRIIRELQKRIDSKGKKHEDIVYEEKHVEPKEEVKNKSELMSEFKKDFMKRMKGLK